MKTKSHLWTLLCWIVLAFAIFAYQSGALISSYIIGACAFLLLVIDFKVQVLGRAEDTESTFEAFFHLDNESGLKKWRLLVVGSAVFWCSQVILNWIDSAHPNSTAPALCYICRR